MPNKSTISISFKIEDGVDGLKTMIEHDSKQLQSCHSFRI